MSTFVLEIFSEEIPSRMQAAARAELHSFFQKGLTEHHLAFSEIDSYVTPRRLVLHITGLPAAQEDQQEEKKGPRVDAPEKAIQGFLASNGLTLDQCTQRDLGKKGTFFFAEIFQKGRAAPEILAELTDGFLTSMRWPKSMRWGAGCAFAWVRPIHHIMLLFDGEPVAFEPPHPGIQTGALSYGHRFMAPGPFEVASWKGYQDKLLAHKVVLSSAKREELISAGYEEKAAALNARLPDAVAQQVQEVAGLVEWPVVCMGRIPEAFLQIPSEVLTTSMWEHQYFTPLYDTQTGALRPEFLFTSNIQAPEGMDQVLQGNESVLRARLQDALFFWETDQKKSLDQWNDHLKKQIFHEKLGTVHERLHRFQVLADLIAPADDDLKEAIAYSKADLASDMVGEFPELQGVMGGYYLAKKGFKPVVCEAVRCQYGDQGFPSKTAALLAFVQKAEALGSFFAVGIQPTSSKDPYALRRAALGLIKIALEHELLIDFLALFEGVWQAVDSSEKVPLESYHATLKTFVLERFRHFLKNDFAPEVAQSVLGAPWIYGDLSKGHRFCQALTEIRDTEHGKAVLKSFDRVHSLLTASKELETKTQVDPSLFQKESETAVWDYAQKVQQSHASALEGGDLTALFGALAPLWDLLTALFDEVMIHDPDPKIQANRLALLREIDALFLSILDFRALG